MTLIDLVALLSTAFLSGASAGGQEANLPSLSAEKPAESQDEVLVIGIRNREKQVDTFVRALTPTSQNSIPRLIDEVCPAVSGLEHELGKAAAARIRQVAAAALMRVGGEKCQPNVVLLVKPDKRAFLQQLARHRPNYFNAVEADEMRRLLSAPGPVAVWRNEGPVDADGVPLRWDNRLGYVNETVAGASRVSAAGRRGTESAVLLIEAGAIEGLTITQLADYAAMRLLARTDPDRLPPTPPPTILTLIDAPAGAAVPITLTKWDLGLLRGLSIAAPELGVGSQRAQIAREISKELARASR